MKKVFAVSLLSLMLAVGLVGVADAQVMTSVSPTNVAPGQSVPVTVRGTGFPVNTACGIPTMAPQSGVTIGACTTDGTGSVATFLLTVDPAAATGGRTLSVTIGGVTDTFAFNIGGIAAPERTIPTGITTAQGFIDALRTLTDWLFVVLVIVAVVFIVLAGLQFITGGGDPTAVSQARTKLIWAAVGIGVALLARGLPEALQNLIGV